MADDSFANGVEEESTSKLERERDELVAENVAKKEQIKKLTAELEESRKMTDVIAARASDLETELSRLQHDMGSEMSAGEDARAKVAELTKAVGDKESRIGVLEKEVEGLKKVKEENEFLEKEVGELKKVAGENELKVRDFERKVGDLERKIGVFETKEVEERNKRIRVEEEVRDKIDYQDKEINLYKQKVKELEKAAAEKKSELEKALRESEEKVTSLESDVILLREEAGEAEKVIRLLSEKAGEAEKVIRSLNEKTVETVRSGVNGMHGDEGKGLKGLNLQWPVVAGSTGAVVVAAAAIYVCYAKRR